jgi:hypothetical protein
VGKWAESPQTRINTGFLLVKSGFLKVGKTGQMARKLTKIHKFSPNRHRFFSFGQKYPGFGQILKPKSGQKNDLLLQRFLT